jgi:putative DNA primase/helicase
MSNRNNGTSKLAPRPQSEIIKSRAEYRAALRDLIDGLTIKLGQNREELMRAASDAMTDPDNGLEPPPDTTIHEAEEMLHSEVDTVLSGIPVYSQGAIATRFLATQAGRLRHVSAWGRWLEWTGTHWQQDETTTIYSKVHLVCKQAGGEAKSQRRESDADYLSTSSFAASVEKLAAGQVGSTTDGWDCNPWLLNTPRGSVDLRTGKLSPNRAADYCTKMTAVGPDQFEDCPLWLHFLDTITNRSVELIAFLRRMAGYALTGLTSEQALFFFYGTGANGKGVFLNTLSRILDTYAVATGTEIFMVSNSDRHPTELARLRGARLVTASETEEGRRWAESRIKQLTGGDPVSARFMRQDFFDYRPQFKLIIAGNHKPSLRTVDEAIRRRFNLVPFSVTIPPAGRDPQLEEKLRAEWPAILRWAINGCVAWQNEKLSAPAIVQDATGHYLQGEDAIGQWMDECCAKEPQATERVTNLFTSWKVWAERSEEFVGSRKTFSQKLEDRGLSRGHNSAGQATFRGIRFAN